MNAAPSMNLLVANIVFSTLVFILACRWLLMPALPRLRPSTIALPILLLHGMRHLGLMFLAPGVVSPDMPAAFAVPAAVGDSLAATLALLCAWLIHRRSTWAHRVTWVFTVLGTADFVMAIALSRIFNAGVHLGGAYWIPAFWVPLLLVGHGVIFVLLRRAGQGGAQLID
jgi:hypothetical protein